METVLWLVLGLIAGVLALFAVDRQVPRDAVGWISALVIGVAGGWIGGWLAGVVGLEAVSWLGSLVIAFLGAALIIWIVRRGSGRRV